MGMEAFADEDIDFAQLAGQLSRERAAAAANRWYGCHKHFDGSLKVRHVYTVAELAWRYTKSLKLEDERSRRYFREVAWVAGLLHEGMMSGASYEVLIEESDQLVARIVADLTPDLRQPWSKRAESYAQVVKLADLKHDLALLRLWFDDKTVGAKLVEVRYQAHEARLAAQALNLYESMDLRPVLECVQEEARSIELAANKKGKQQNG